MSETTTIDNAATAADPIFFLSGVWWAEQIFVWIVFTLLVSWALNQLRIRREAEEREPFEGWELVLLGEDEDGQHQSLHWEEVRRIRDSDFERWKLVKSAMSGVCSLTVTRLEPAQKAGWVRYDGKKLVIDFNKVPPEHLKNRCWTTLPQHLSDDALCQEECFKSDESASEGGLMN